MRPSPLRHPLAVLRQIIGLSQKELGELCECSPRTVQAVELLKLPLSGILANKISSATGVSVEWLLDGDPTKNPTIRGFEAEKTPESMKGFEDKDPWRNEDYNKYSFETYRAILDRTTKEGYPNNVIVVTSKSPRRLQEALRLSMHLRGSTRELRRTEGELAEMFNAFLKATKEHPQGLVLRWRLKQFLQKEIASASASSGGKSASDASAEKLSSSAKPVKRRRD